MRELNLAQRLTSPLQSLSSCEHRTVSKDGSKELEQGVSQIAGYEPQCCVGKIQDVHDPKDQ